MNNRATRDVFIEQSGSFVTEPCVSAGISPLRNCGFAELPDADLACTFEESLANLIIGNDPTTVSFVCPQLRDAEEPGEGGYALYTAPIWPEEAAQAIVPIVD